MFSKWWYGAIMMGIIVYTVAMFGVVTGAQTAYTANSTAEIGASFNGTHITIGGEVDRIQTVPTEDTTNNAVAEKVNDPRVGWLSQYLRTGKGVLADAARESAAVLVKASFSVVAVSADLASRFFYANQWIPMWLTNGVFKVAQIPPLLGVGAVVFDQILTIREVL